MGLNGSAALYLRLLRNVELVPGWYEDWILFEQVRLRLDRLNAFQIIARQTIASCDYVTVREAAEAGLEIEVLYESAVRLLIQAEMEPGNNACALRAFETYEAKLKKEMGIAPSEAIRRLVADIICLQVTLPAFQNALNEDCSTGGC